MSAVHVCVCMCDLASMLPLIQKQGQYELALHLYIIGLAVGYQIYRPKICYGNVTKSVTKFLL